MKTIAIKKQLTAKREKPEPKRIPASDLLSTGSILLNCALTDRAIGGLVKGKLYQFVGASDSGKSFLCMNMLAEAAYNKNFDGYKLIYNNAEDGALMDIGKFFGAGAEERIEVTASDSLDAFYDSITLRIKKQEPFVEILDSMDALEALVDSKKFEENRARRKKGEQAKGDYGGLKPKMNSENLRKIRARLVDTGSILVIVSQERDVLNTFGYGEKTTYSGGRSVKFYAATQIWSTVKKNIANTVRGNKMQMGILASIKVKKNHITGKKRSVEVPIYHSYGVDDLGSCIDYLTHWKEWKVAGGLIRATDLNLSLKRNALIKAIEDNNLQRDLRKVVQRVWNEVEDASELKRKPRYQ